MDIIVENLTKKYDQQKAVDQISFQVQTGEILGFLGPNGAGKTTTMKILTCFMAPSEGEIKIGDYSIYSDTREIKKHIGYLPENNPLYYDMPVIEYLEYSALLQGIEKSKINGRIKEMIDICGLGIEKHKNIGELSKGYRQRVGLAQAMIHDPDILILDEPTSGLDPNQIVEIRKLIKELGKEKTVILSTHILPEVEATCDRILIINKGKIVADGTAESLQSQAQGNEILQIQIEGADNDTIFEALGKIKTIQTIEPISGKNGFFIIHSKTGTSSKKEIFNLCVQKKWFLLEQTPKETKLEDIFRKLTT